MPGLPGRPTPPVNPVPPTGVLPGEPGRPVPPTGPLSPGITYPPGTVAPVETAETASRCTYGKAGKVATAPCDQIVVPYTDQGPVAAPITPGRDLAATTLWNVWTDLRFSGIDDDRGRGNTEIDGVFFSLGVDRVIAPNAVAGLQFEIEQSDRDSFAGGLTVDRTSVAAGPYVSVLVNDRWAISGLLTVGTVSSNINILGLSGASDQLQTSASLSASGQYQWSALTVRPQLGLTYTHVSGDDIALSGSVAGRPVVVEADLASGWNGSFTPSVEFSRVFTMNSVVLMPFAELGAIYSFGETGSAISPAQTSDFEDWAGTFEVGTRIATRGGMLLEAAVAYNSIFVDDLDTMEARVFASWNF